MNTAPALLTKTRLARALSFLLLVACDAPGVPLDRCAGSPQGDAANPVSRLEIRPVVADAPLVLGQELTWGDMTLRATKARFYVSQVALIGAQGERVDAELVDAHGDRLPYELALVDLAQPGSLQLHLRAPAGRYSGLAVSIGVPPACSSGETLNHADASAMQAPLDVDSDMYWSWNSGYVHLKYEGQISKGAGWDRFFYHVGGDQRLADLEIAESFVISHDRVDGPVLIADFDRLFRSADGDERPHPKNADQRRVHGGDLADAMASNAMSSGFLRFDQQEAR